MLQAAILGAQGRMGRAHRDAYTSVGVPVSHQIDLDSYGDVDVVMSDGETDIISIATPDNQHALQVLYALESGKHVFCEKPLCYTRQELEDIISIWESQGEQQHVQQNLVLRGAPIYRWLGDAISQGKLGRIYSFDAEYVYGRLEKLKNGWRGTISDYSVLLGGGIHLVDLMLWLTGGEPHTVTSHGVKSAGFDFPDHVCSTFLFENDLVGRITANFSAVHPHTHVLRVYGTEGTFILDDFGPRLYFDSNEPVQRLNVPVLPPSKGCLIPGFISDIHEEKDPQQAFSREITLISTVLAAQESLSP